jgi:hypothetical protein
VFAYDAVINGTHTECNEAAQVSFPYNCTLYGAIVAEESNSSDVGYYMKFNSNSELKFSNNTSLNLKTDISGNNLYFLWEESKDGYLSSSSSDLLFKRINNNGSTFSKTINMGKLIPYTQPSIYTNNNFIYILWNGNENSSNDILFKKSDDNGSTFSKTITIGEGNFPAIAVENSNIYIVWIGKDGDDDELLFKKSDDNGSTFSKTIKINSNAGSMILTDPNVIASGNKVYVIWHGEHYPVERIIFIRTSIDNGFSFGNIIPSN